MPVYDIAFRDPEVLATVGREGVLRVIDIKQERLFFAAASYFGSLTCVAWSPDGKYLITGGQDDLVRASTTFCIVLRCAVGEHLVL